MAPWIFSLCLSSERETLQLFYSPNVLPVTQPTVSKHRRELKAPMPTRKSEEICSSAIEWHLQKKGRCTLFTVALHSSSHAVGSICSLPAATSCLYLTTGVWCSLVRPSLWLARRPGSCYVTLFVTRHVRSTVFFSQSASVHTAL